MALTATLALDIRAFEGGLSRATASLEGFAQKTVKNTNRDLSQMLEGFTGQKVVAESARMAEAVERVGGASRLTEAEQRRVNATVTEAIEKYRVLGQEAPAQLVKLQQETSGAVEKTGLLTRGMQALIGVFSIRAIARAAGDVLEFTGTLTDLAGKTGITTDGLQRLNYVTSQSGVSLEQVASGVVMLSKNLVKGNVGIDALKMSVDDLLAIGPEKAFLAIGEAIAKVPNPAEQAALAIAIFGKSGADYLPAFTTDMKALADEAQRSGAILGSDLVAGGDRAGDAITRLQAAGLAVLGNFFLPMMPAIEALANAFSTRFPSALLSAQQGVTSLLGKGLELEVWLTSTAESIARAVADVPVLGQVFGQTAGDVGVLAARTQFAKDALAAFRVDGVKPAGEAAGAAAPMVTNLAEAMEKSGRAAKKAKEDHSIVFGSIDWITRLLIDGELKLNDYATATDNAAKSMDELAIAIAHASGEMYDQNGALVLISKSLTQAALDGGKLTKWANETGAVFPKAVQAMGSAVESEVPKWSSIFDSFAKGLPTVIMNAFQGGGDVLKSAGSLAGNSLGTFLSQRFGETLKSVLGPALGGAFSALLPGLGSLLGPLIGKLTSMFSGIFGASSKEKAGRALVAAFEQNLHGALTATQELQAGGEDWKKTVIAIRDAYIAAGRTEQEALADAEKLWKSSTISAEESARVIEEIRRKMDALPTNKTIEIDVKYNDDGSPANPDGLPTSATQPVGPFIPAAPGSSAMSQSGASQAPVVVVVTTIRRDDIDPVEIGNMAAAAVAQHYPRNGFDLKTIITDSLREA